MNDENASPARSKDGMRLILIARVAAVALSVGTFGFLFVGDAWRGDNPFLVPDLILCALLLVAACLPKAWAPHALIFAFGISAGVLATAVSSLAVAGRLGIASLLAALAAVVMAVVLIRFCRRTGI